MLVILMNNDDYAKTNLISEYNRFMNAGRYAFALEMAHKLGDSDLFADTIIKAENFYKKYPTLSEKNEFEEMKNTLGTDISDKM